jgi:hypothetical protein
MSESGMAMTGTSTERTEPRNRKMMITTINRVSPSVLTTSVDRVVDVVGGVVGDAGLPAGRQFLLDQAISARTRLDDVDRVGVGQRIDAHEHGGLPGEAHLGAVVLGAERHVGDVAQRTSVLSFADHQILEFLHRTQIGVGRQVDLDQSRPWCCRRRPR